MGRVILYVGFAAITFVIGTAANWSANILGGVAVDKFYRDPGFDLSAFSIAPRAGLLSVRANGCGRLVVSVTSDGLLNLNSMPMGTLNDTTLLTTTLRTIFEQRERTHLYVARPELSLKVPADQQLEKTVWIKAPRNISYGEVADLIAVIKATGADPVGLIAVPTKADLD
jgi:biopolymer transport protein ExbD